MHVLGEDDLAVGLHALDELERTSREIDAARVQLLAGLIGNVITATGTPVWAQTLAGRSLKMEIALLLGVSEPQAERLLDSAATLCTSYPALLTLVTNGAVSVRNARVVTDAGVVLHTGDLARDRVVRAAYEEAIIVYAVTETPNRLQPIAERYATQYSQASLEADHERALRGRRVRMTKLDSGMAKLTIVLAAEDSVAIVDRVRKMSTLTLEAMHANSAAGPVPGTGTGASEGTQNPGAVLLGRDEVGANIIRDLILEGVIPTAPVTGHGVTGVVQVIVQGTELGINETDIHGSNIDVEPTANGTGVKTGSETGTDAVPTSGGAAEQTPELSCPSELVGYGIIDHGTARNIAARTLNWDQAIIDERGKVLDTQRFPSAKLRRTLQARDIHCRAPGCNASVSRCEVDHPIPWSEGGQTVISNLAHLCKNHHTLKGFAGWKVRQDKHGGALHWESPAGFTYVEHPPSNARFTPVPDPLPPGARKRTPTFTPVAVVDDIGEHPF